MRRKPLVLAAACLSVVLVSGFAAPPAEAAITVEDIQHIILTYAHYVTRLYEVYQKYLQIYNQYQQLYYQILALTKNDTYWSRSIVPALSSMEQRLGYGELPTHMNERVASVFGDTYRGWQSPQDFWQEERKAAETTLATLRETLAAKYTEHRVDADHIRTVEELKNQVHTIDGTQKALEVIAQIVAFQAEATVLGQAGEKTSADAATAGAAYFANRFAREERSLQEALESSNQVPPETTGNGWRALPSWWRY